MAAHGGRKTVMARGFGAIQDVLLTIGSGSSGTLKFLAGEGGAPLSRALGSGPGRGEGEWGGGRPSNRREMRRG